MKASTTGEHVLRVEAIAHNTRDLKCGRVLDRWGDITSRLADMVNRFCTGLYCVDVAFIPNGLLDELPTASQLGAIQRASGLSSDHAADDLDSPTAAEETFVMADRDDLVEWVQTTLHDAELALHNGDASLRRACWSRHEPVSVLGAWRNAVGLAQVDELFTFLAKSLSNCTSFEIELKACDVVGDMAYTVGIEHTSASVDGQPRRYTLRVTQVYRREEGLWKVAHRHGDLVTD